MNTRNSQVTVRNLTDDAPYIPFIRLYEGDYFIYGNALHLRTGRTKGSSVQLSSGCEHEIDPALTVRVAHVTITYKVAQ